MVCVCAGMVQTLMSVDADRVVNLCMSLHDLWSLPVQIGIALFLLYTQVSSRAPEGTITRLCLFQKAQPSAPALSLPYICTEVEQGTMTHAWSPPSGCVRGVQGSGFQVGPLMLNCCYACRSSMPSWLGWQLCCCWCL